MKVNVSFVVRLPECQGEDSPLHLAPAQSRNTARQIPRRLGKRSRETDRQTKP